MSEFMNDGPSPGGGSPGQAPLTGGQTSRSGGGMAPMRENPMASLRERWSRNLQPQGSSPVKRKAIGNQPNPLLKKGKKKVDLDPRARLRQLKKKRAALRTLRKERH